MIMWAAAVGAMSAALGKMVKEPVSKPEAMDMGPDTWRDPSSPYYDPLRVKREEDEKPAAEKVEEFKGPSFDVTRRFDPGLGVFAFSPRGFTIHVRQNHDDCTRTVIIRHDLSGRLMKLDEHDIPKNNRELYEILYRLMKGEEHDSIEDQP